jgi:hypothetical protein
MASHTQREGVLACRPLWGNMSSAVEARNVLTGNIFLGEADDHSLITTGR